MQEKAHQPVGGVSGAGDEQEQRDQLEERRLAPVGRGDGNGEGAERSSGTADPEGGRMRDIENLDCSAEFNAANFGVIKYTDRRGRRQRAYAMTRDG